MRIKLITASNTLADSVNALLNEQNYKNKQLGSAVLIKYAPEQHNQLLNIIADWGYIDSLSDYDHNELNILIEPIDVTPKRLCA